MKKALDVLGEGRTFPILYNDDVNVPAVMNAFRVHETEAAHYQPYGCGEYGLDHIAFGSPNSSFNILAALDATLRGGRAVHGCKTCGACGGTMTHRHDVPEADEFKNFDEFFEAFQGQVRYYGRTLAQAHALELEVERKDAAFLFPSMLMDGCLESGRSLVDGGVKYLGGISESMGMVNTADALAAIKKIVFEEKRVSLDQLVRMLDANWLGYERERQLFLNAPKYGNDEPEVDRILREIARTACNAVRDAASEVGMDYYLLVNIMNHVHVGVGKEMGATPDGRKAGMPLANAGSPTAGNDKKGVTAYLNSITSFEPELHAGFVFNLKLGRRMFREDRAKLEALLGAYWARGGSQIMITCVNRDDLVQAMERPEEHHNLIVRVGGFSARFVELNRDLQLDLIKRTFYE
jgi:pyruvate-formate lyase